MNPISFNYINLFYYFSSKDYFNFWIEYFGSSRLENIK